MKKGIRLAAAALITVLCVGTAGCGIGLIREAVSRGRASDAEVSRDSADRAADPQDSGKGTTGSGTAEAGARTVAVWPGIYALDGDPAGEIFAVLNADGQTVTGWYLYETAAGDFGMRSFAWDIADEDAMTATEPFGNGSDQVDIFRLRNDRITVNYPDGWWDDRDYLYLCDIADAGAYVTNPEFDLSLVTGSAPGGTAGPENAGSSGETAAPAAADTAASQPFYGIWVLGSHDPDECRDMVSRLQSQGYAGAAVFYTTDWSNLNTEPWYVVTAGCYATEEEADAALPGVRAAGYEDAYVKYSGERQAYDFAG